ncbi:peptidoglycan/xylan/chitin deacetylase (PgdA/CDA1 family) [Gelidibacter sediminis]|uniref:Peptidoglycan/xylan/chitin deacetylase (PgdA/CDA1 family) n=1 Tax=Gelidibacter sediminis TaxID=1608710 RepID=A0A4R7Q7X7_9FLAO|nr:polysaccharide deacetylase family protein [Gelidibacter sediminis]TDU43763.1 peptidoglycan/xylan/chitin deacetylase (PgdA/CDA1 family) [Gelidibacter sediminis]
MNLIPIKTPTLIKGIFPDYTWNMPTDQKTLYLTFDDGPTPEITNWTLDLLKSYQAKATFFCIGNNVKKHPHIFQDILNNGHVVGNHTFNHPYGWRTNTENYLAEVFKTNQIMHSVLEDWNSSTRLFRPPYGQIKPHQGKQLIALGYQIIMWDILSFDWKQTLSKETCAQNVITKAGPGSIVVFHDSVKAAPRMKHALLATLEHFSNQGYQFKSIKF